MAEGKSILDKAILAPEVEDALSIFNRAIGKASNNSQVPQVNQLHHLRGLCYFKLKQFELAEKDFQEAILMSDDKSKVAIYHSLGKCKMQLAHKDPLIVHSS